MTERHDRLLLSFLEGELSEVERLELLDELDRDPALAEKLRAAGAGLEAVRDHRERARSAPAPTGTRVPAWWVPAAVAATILVVVPTLRLGPRAEPSASGTQAAIVETGVPVSPEPSFVLVLHGRWPDALTVSPEETRRRADEYWAWTSSLADRGVLIAAGDLRWEPGERLGPEGARLAVDAQELQDDEYLVGMFSVRAGSYDEALEVARGCPHLRYGGSVSIRRVGGGFVTMPGMGDWTD